MNVSRLTPSRFATAGTPRLKMQRRGGGMAGVALVIVGCLLAVLLGMVSYTASPILIGVIAGGLLGLALLGMPLASLWIVLSGTLLVGGLIVQFVPVLTRANWLFSMLGFLLFASALIAPMLRRESLEPRLPRWSVLALLLPLYAIVVALINTPNVFEFLAGFKRYFQFWGLFAAFALILFKPKVYRSVGRFVLALALVQVFFAAFQRVFVVPTREGMGGGVVAIDAVSGTFEASQKGGGSSSVLVFFVLIAFAFVMRLWLDGKLGRARMAIATVLLLAPLALGETKVVVVFLPIVLACVLMLDLKRHPFRTVSILVLGLVATAALAVLYLTISAKAGESTRTVWENIISYNFGNTGYHSASNLNRTTVLSFWWSQQHLGDPVGFLFGHGVGASYLGDGALVAGKLAMKYGGLQIGFTAISGLLWDLGVLGMGLFMAFNAGAIWMAFRQSQTLPAGVPRSLAVAALAGLLMNIVLLLMSNSAVSLPSHSVLYMLLLASVVLLDRWRAAPGDA
jgi:hypothetical protein